SGVRLTIQRDAVIKFQTTTSKLIVDGTIDVQGTFDSPVYFTSYKDDGVGGDTNGDGAGTSPAAGNWDTIKFESGSSSTLAYAVIRYGGNAASSKMIYNAGGNVTFTNSTINDGAIWGIYADSGTTTVVSADIYNNQTGIACVHCVATVVSSA